VFPVLKQVIRINEDVVDIDNEANIEHIAENVIHETLKNHGTIGKTARHDLPLKRTISGLKGGLPLITFHLPRLGLDSMHAKGRSLYKADPCEAHLVGPKSTETDLSLTS
jgi:hypothetical protein